MGWTCSSNRIWKICVIHWCQFWHLSLVKPLNMYCHISVEVPCFTYTCIFLCIVFVWLHCLLGNSYSFLRHHVQTGSRAHSASCPMVLGYLLPVVNQPNREADHSPPSTVEVKNARIFIPAPSYVFLSWCWSAGTNVPLYLSPLLTEGRPSRR
jgi:hypothetical protein